MLRAAPCSSCGPRPISTYNDAMRVSCAHPIRLAALTGGVVGLIVALSIEVGGAVNRNSGAVIHMLLPAAGYGGLRLSQVGLMQAAVILLIEIGANVLVYAAMFAAPVALAVLIRRVASRRRTGI